MGGSEGNEAEQGGWRGASKPVHLSPGGRFNKLQYNLSAFDVLSELELFSTFYHLSCTFSIRGGILGGKNCQNNELSD